MDFTGAGGIQSRVERVDPGRIVRVGADSIHTDELIAAADLVDLGRAARIDIGHANVPRRGLGSQAPFKTIADILPGAGQGLPVARGHHETELVALGAGAGELWRQQRVEVVVQRGRNIRARVRRSASVNGRYLRIPEVGLVEIRAHPLLLDREAAASWRGRLRVFGRAALGIGRGRLKACASADGRGRADVAAVWTASATSAATSGQHRT